MSFISVAVVTFPFEYLLSFVLVKFHWQGGESEGKTAFMVNYS